MSNRRKILNVILGGLILFFIFTIWYSVQYSMDKVAPFEINNDELNNRVLIASQGSDYKNTVVADVISSFHYDSIYIKVIDVHELGKEKADAWDAILILHTWEIGVPPNTVTEFMEEIADRRKLIVVSTSGSGEEYIEGVDGISSASLMWEVPNHVQFIVDRIYNLITANKATEITGILKNQ